MKKLFFVLFTFLLMLPIVVKADIIFVNTFYNDNVSVDDEVVVSTLLNFDYFPHKIEYSYDQNMLMITNSNITTPSSSDEIKIENGKVTITVHETGPLDTYGQGYVTLRFTALKSGKTEIIPFLGATYYSIPGKLEVNIKENSTNSKEETKPVEDETTSKDEIKKEPKGDKNKDLVFFTSLGINIIELLIIVALIVKNKKNKNI